MPFGYCALRGPDGQGRGLPIQSPIRNRLSDMSCLDGGRLRQVGDGARDFYNAMVSAGRETQSFNGLLQQSRDFAVDRAILTDLFWRQPVIQFVGALQLFCSRGLNALSHFGAGWAGSVSIAQDLMRHLRYLQMQVDAVQQGAGYAGAIAFYLFGGAMAASARVAQITAGA